MVFVTQVDVGRVDADDVRGDQQPFEKAVRVAFEVGAVLEGAGLALVDVDGHQARRRLLAHDAPLAAGRESGAAEAPQAGVVECCDEFVAAAFTADDLGGERVATGGAVGVEVDEGRRDAGVAFADPLFGERGGIERCAARSSRMPRQPALHRCDHRTRIGARHRALVHDRHRRLLAAPDARRGDHAGVGAEQRRQTRQQVTRAGQLAAQAVAHAHRDGCGRLAFTEDLEVVVEARDLVDLGHRHVGLAGECDQVPLVQAAVRVVQQVQVLDQTVSRPAGRRHLPEQRAHFGERGIVHLPAFQPALALDALAHLLGGDRCHHRHGFQRALRMTH